MLTKTQKLYLKLSYFNGIGPVRFLRLFKKYHSIEKIFNLNKNQLYEIVGEKIAENFINFKNNFLSDSIESNMYKKSIQLITLEDFNYPSQLVQIYDPPMCLYAIGNTSLLNNQENILAVVGTRNPTHYGQIITKELVLKLASSNLITASGMAIGIDTIVHKTSIESNSATIAVLGSGIDIIYPPSNKSLYEKIIQNNGLIISEYPPQTIPNKGNFIGRNRIISGLSKGVVIIEGNEKSGALITAKFGLEQNKNIYAIPGPINSEYSKGPNYLIKNGAKPVLSAEDILEDFPNSKQNSKTSSNINLSKNEEKIVNLLKTKPLTEDEIAININESIENTLETLSLMEINEIVYKNIESKYENIINL